MTVEFFSISLVFVQSPISMAELARFPIFDYHRILSKTGWKVTHRIECPLSSERMSGNQVQKMQDKRILGTVGRTLLVAKRS